MQVQTSGAEWSPPNCNKDPTTAPSQAAHSFTIQGTLKGMLIGSMQLAITKTSILHMGTAGQWMTKTYMARAMTISCAGKCQIHLTSITPSSTLYNDTTQTL